MFSDRSVVRFGEDLFNLSNHRNIKNTPKSWYNCAGYALGTFSWYLPSDNDDLWGDFVEKADYAKITAIAVEKMLKDFPTLRVIQSENETKKDEYCIAFRISSDGDFHYAKKGKNNIWYHKQGAWSWIDTMTAKQLYSKKWGCRYDGPLVLFAKKI